MISFVHTVCGFLALPLGATVLLSTKGTRFHRSLGAVYWVIMLTLNLTAFGIYRLFGGFGIFHIFAIVSLATILGGLIPVAFRKRIRNWLYLHYQFMCWSYAGLLAATSNEAFAHLSPFKALVRTTGPWIVLATQMAVLCVSAFVIGRRQKIMLGRYGYPRPPSTAIQPTAAAPGISDAPDSATSSASGTSRSGCG